MNIVNVDLVSEPLTPKDSIFIADKNYPFCLLGFQLKHSYDQNRLQLKDNYHIKDYTHFLPDSDCTPIFFRGINITPKAELIPLLNQLERFNVSLTDLPTKRYTSLLAEYKLTCKNCYGSLQKGVYPVDGECVNFFAKEEVNLDDLYSNAFNVDLVPSFQSYGYFTIFILQNKSVFRSGTDNIISKIRNNIASEK